MLIDELDAPRGWDRATVIHPRSIEIFEALGMADGLLAESARMTKAEFHSDGEPLGELDLSLVDSPYKFDLQLSEERTERLLTEYLARPSVATVTLPPRASRYSVRNRSVLSSESWRSNL